METLTDQLADLFFTRKKLRHQRKLAIKNAEKGRLDSCYDLRRVYKLWCENESAIRALKQRIKLASTPAP